ncbi:efflux RND transporter periplasmic adaptor subunit [Gudongella oleilytica]|uniref:efflux RND transporter periplasmic adaptor subunit n=1 Tax=Gudongella oleilytica TaxID=1582259 RepID=UPI002A36A581|nr:efflux RND transporter periplasmic adaptor subunit [Gudongella oleilytica]MDY0255877.1 efflux RND transporter periplasmic adaptor subunit [Gudongella oleilytica]
MKNRAKKGFMTIGLITALALSGCTSGPVEEEKGDVYTPVEIATVELGSLESTVTLSGRLSANEQVSIIPKASGIVESVNVRLGDMVEVGDILFTIEQNDYSRNVEQAQNSIQLAQKSVDQAANGLNSAKINFELNKEKIENAMINLERTRILYEEGAVSKSQLEQAELSASQLSLDAIQGQVKQAEIAYQQSLSQLEQAKVGYDQAQSGLDNTVVKSPIKGTVSALNVVQGQIAAASQVAATVVEMDRVYLQVNVVENIVTKLQEGQKAQVRVSALSEEFIESTVEYVSPTADPRSQLYTVRVYLDNADKAIKPGMSGEVKLVLDSVDKAIIVKSDAVLDEDGESFVYVVQDGKAIKRTVEVGLDTGDHVEVKSGLTAGEKLIIEGQYYVADGGEVKVVRGE